MTSIKVHHFLTVTLIHKTLYIISEFTQIKNHLTLFRFWNLIPRVS